MNKKEFDAKFEKLITPYVESYNGPQPIISWDSNYIRPSIQPEFYNHLPKGVREEIKTHLESLK